MGRTDSGAQGLLLLDKPLGWTSHDAVAWVRRRLGTRRVGHAGTLDPLATGLLLVAVGATTRLVELLTGHDKTYLATIQLGATSDSGDAEGPLHPTGMAPPPAARLEEAVRAALDHLMPAYDQAPPRYSARKIGGQPAYVLARRGDDVQLTPRRVRLLAADPIPLGAMPPRARPDAAPPSFVAGAPALHLRLDVGSGFYVRSLARDLGEALGCGAYLAALRRTAIAAFRVDEALDPLQVEESEAPATLARALRPPDDAARGLPRLVVPGATAALIDAGRPYHLEWPVAQEHSPSFDGPLYLVAEPDFRALARLEADHRVVVTRRLTPVTRAWQAWRLASPEAGAPANAASHGPVPADEA